MATKLYPVYPIFCTYWYSSHRDLIEIYSTEEEAQKACINLNKTAKNHAWSYSYVERWVRGE
jgi:hypothetical protein